MKPSRVSLILRLLFALCGGAWIAAAAAAAPRPNIVLMVADDLGWGELGCYGQEKIRTPNIDRLAREGMRFTRHYSGAPVCAPSRCVLLTGRHTGRCEIRGNLPATLADGSRGEGQHPIADETLTLAEVLRGAGYATGAMGKWGLGPVTSAGAPHRQGFDRFFGYNCQSVAHSYYPPHLWRNEVKVPLNSRPIPGHARQPDGPVQAADWTGERYAPDVMTSEAVRFLEENRQGPFFLYLPFIEPHVALQPPADLLATYPEEWDDRPYRGQCNYTPHPRPRAAYAALISSLDRHVGRILRTLDDLHLATNTLVIFTSDNGTTHTSPADPVFGVGGVDATFFHSTAGLRGRKGSLHEGGIRVPLIVRWPGQVAAGSTSPFPSHFVDHFPTLCQAAQLAPPPGLDGISLMPILTGQGPVPTRPPMVWVFPEYGGQVAVRINDHKVIRKDLKTPQPGPWEVYNLAQDPNEARDLAASHARLIAKAESILRRELKPNPTFPVPVPGINVPASPQPPAR